MRPFLCKWEELPSELRIPEVRPYWEKLNSKYGQVVAKRVFDVAGSVALIAVLSPAMIATAIAIKKESAGPVMYRQERVTQYGKRFKIHKFRTMVVDADRIGALVTSEGDPRVTKVGSFLRKYRIDEFPQLFDILNGDMSFVGTRPEVPKYVAAYTSEMLATLLLPAGVTSRASIEFKDEASLIDRESDPDKGYVDVVLPLKMERNLFELSQFGFMQEIKTMLDTVVAVIG